MAKKYSWRYWEFAASQDVNHREVLFEYKTRNNKHMHQIVQNISSGDEIIFWTGQGSNFSATIYDQRRFSLPLSDSWWFMAKNKLQFSPIQKPLSGAPPPLNNFWRFYLHKSHLYISISSRYLLKRIKKISLPTNGIDAARRTLARETTPPSHGFACAANAGECNQQSTFSVLIYFWRRRRIKHLWRSLSARRSSSPVRA